MREKVKLEDLAKDDYKNIKITKKKMLNYFIDIGLAVTFILAFITGLIKFPGVLNALELTPRELPMYEISIIHDYSAMLMGILILAHLLLHAKWIKGMTVKLLRRKKRLSKKAIVVVIIILLLLVFIIPAILRILFVGPNVIIIEGIGDFKYDPDEIETVRPDIFKAGHFSIFDILVDLNNRSKINLKYHFDEGMNTHVIDSINGKKNWWYDAYYDGGWSETNVYRMDHYPYKEKMYIKLIQVSSGKIDRIHEIYIEETLRSQSNSGKIIIPNVIIRGKDDKYTFTDVEVTAHNLRNDFFQPGMITAIDVIMTLGDQGLIDYELQWYDSIGSSEVKNYYVDKINGDKSRDRCGFVYEEGSNRFSGFDGNHIHIPADIRVINSPEYEEWYWICI